MPATFNFGEDNGAATGSPAHGTTRSGIGNSSYATDVNWKSVDDCTANGGTAYTSAPVNAGNSSYTKYQYGIFSGTYNQILNCKWSAHTAGSLGSGLTLVGTVSSTYATPATTNNAALTTAFTSVVAVGSGLSVNFSATDPSAASPASTLSSGGGYTQYLCTQMQTSGSAAAGNSATITTTLQYDEN